MVTDSSAGALPFEEYPLDMDQWSFFAEQNPTLNPLDPNCLNCPDLKPDCGLNCVFGSDDPFSDPSIWDFGNWSDDGVNGKLSQSGGFGFEGEISNYGVGGNFNGVEGSGGGVFSVSPNCCGCLRLRVIVHTNGMNVKRLEIHGTIGTITHAALETYDSSFQIQDFQMFDFHKESTQIVKSFLVNYFETCKQEGYTLLQDPLSTFYEALCVGLMSPGGCQKKEQEMMRQEPKHVKIPLSVQKTSFVEALAGTFTSNAISFLTEGERARTRELELKDMIELFDLPMEEAARKMNVCPTVLKKICRRSGLLRWPYRKIRSIKRKISEKRKVLNASDHNEEKAQLIADIEKHQQELANIYEAFNH